MSPEVRFVTTLDEVWGHLTGRLKAIDALLLAEARDRSSAVREAFLPPHLRQTIRTLAEAVQFAGGVRALCVPARVLTQVRLPSDEAAQVSAELARGRGEKADDPDEHSRRALDAPMHADLRTREKEDRTRDQVRPLAELLTAWEASGFDTAKAFQDQPGVSGTAVVVLGDPGYGKSFVTYSHALERLIAYRANAGIGRLPLRVTARKLNEALTEKRGRTLAKAVARVVSGRCPKEDSEAVKKIVLRAMTEHSAVLFVDAWDEAGDTDRLTELLREWVSHGGPLLLTSRAVGYPPGLFHHAAEWQLMPADDPAPLVAGWFAADPPKGEKLVHEVQSRPRLGQTLRVPLLSAITCTLWDAGQFTLPASRTTLMGMLVEYLLTIASRSPMKPPDMTKVVSVLGEVAVRTFTGERWKLSQDWFRRAAAERCLEVGLDVNEVFAVLTEKHGLFSMTGEDEYEVIHQQVAEYLCAVGLARRIGGGGAAEVTAERMRTWLGESNHLRFLDPRWQEVWCHLAGLLPEPAFDVWMEGLDAIRQRKEVGAKGCEFEPPEDVFDAALCLMGHLIASRSDVPPRKWFDAVEPELFFKTRYTWQEKSLIAVTAADGCRRLRCCVAPNQLGSRER